MQTSLVNPFGLPDADGYMWLKGNLHTHTTNSDGRVAPQARLDQYAAKGYDFLCLSDHDTITRVDTVCAPDDFVLVQGAELHPLNPFGGRQYHLLCLDIHEDMDSEAMAPQEVIDSVNDQGGAVWRELVIVPAARMQSVAVTQGPLARRLRLATVGFLMYINPTMQFLIALLIFKETLHPTMLITFVLIWSGLALYTASTFFQHRARQRGLYHP